METIHTNFHLFSSLEFYLNGVKSTFSVIDFVATLFPLDGRWWLARNVVHYAVDVLHFIYDASGNFVQNIVRDASPVGRHAIDRCHGADTDCVVIRTAVAHYAYAAEAWQDCKILPYIAVQTSIRDFFAQDVVRFADDF